MSFSKEALITFDVAERLNVDLVRSDGSCRPFGSLEFIGKSSLVELAHAFIEHLLGSAKAAHPKHYYRRHCLRSQHFVS